MNLGNLTGVGELITEGTASIGQLISSSANSIADVAASVSGTSFDEDGETRTFLMTQINFMVSEASLNPNLDKLLKGNEENLEHLRREYKERGVPIMDRMFTGNELKSALKAFHLLLKENRTKLLAQEEEERRLQVAREDDERRLQVAREDDERRLQVAREEEERRLQIFPQYVATLGYKLSELSFEDRIQIFSLIDRRAP